MPVFANVANLGLIIFLFLVALEVLLNPYPPLRRAEPLDPFSDPATMRD